MYMDVYVLYVYMYIHKIYGLSQGFYGWSEALNPEFQEFERIQ